MLRRMPSAGVLLLAAVLGLIIPAAISGSIVAAEQGVASSGVWPQVEVTLRAVGFLAGSLLVGTWITPRLFSGAARLRGSGILIGVSLAFCFLLAHLAGVAGLAPIVGAFAAGLILEPVHFQKFGERNIHFLEDSHRPLGELPAPVFFVQMGAKVDLTSFVSTEALRSPSCSRSPPSRGSSSVPSASSTGRSTGGPWGSG